MISAEDLEKLQGMKHVRYVDADKNVEWNFLNRIVEELLKEVESLTALIAQIKDEHGKQTVQQHFSSDKGDEISTLARADF